MIFILLLYAITTLVNTLIPIEKKISKTTLRKGIIAGALLSFGILFIQLTIFEVFLCRGFGVCLFEQDIRIQFISISLIYVITFFISLKFKFIPEAREKSELKIQLALKALESQKEMLLY